MEQKSAAPALLGQLEKKKLEDFVARYANNTFLESTAWDLRMVFGQVDLGENSLLQHTSITIPWPQVKILGYLINIHLAGYETDHGRIPLIKDAVTPVPAELPRELSQAGATGDTWKIMRRLYEEFVSDNPEVNPQLAKELGINRHESRKK